MVRFSGTRLRRPFRQVDPLFVMDLSAPIARRPWSTQDTGLFTIPTRDDENHLIGIGRDADETWDNMGPWWSRFSMTNPAFPHLQDRYEFDGGRSTFSPLPWHPA